MRELFFKKTVFIETINMKNIRQLVKKILFEAHGIQLLVKECTLIVSNDILDSLERNFTKINDGHGWELSTQTYTPEEIKKGTKIELIKVHIDFKLSNEFKIGGDFKPNKTILFDDNSYEIIIGLKIETNTLENILPQIKSAISHELNHAFVYIKDLSGKSKLNTLNKSYHSTKNELVFFLKDNPAIKEFLNMIYLANPYEVQARVQQSAFELEHINERNAEDTIVALLQYSPLRDAKIMISYNLNEINKLDNETLKTFVKKFNDNIKSFSKEENPKTIYETEKFFNYWKNVINNAGDTLAKKIYKIVADKHQIHEADVYEQTSGRIYERIFGESYGFSGLD